MESAAPGSTAGNSFRSRPWFKSSASNGAYACVEVCFDALHVHVRDSKYLLDPSNDPSEQPVMAVPTDSWTVFLGEVTGDLPAGVNGALKLVPAADGSVTLRSLLDGTSLVYTGAEVDAFVAGVRAGEFDPQLAMA